MKSYPSVPHVEDAPNALLDGGHLWVLEKVDGAHLRFQLRESGHIRFGNRNREYTDPDDIPLSYRHAVRHVRERLDRHALRSAVENVERVVFFGEAMHRHGIEYDWERTPSFLGFEIWSADPGEFLSPDAVDQVFDRIGLHPVNAVERELPTRDFNPGPDTVPQSAWYDGPAEGVVIRNKRGGRAQLPHPDRPDRENSTPPEMSASEYAETLTTGRRFERIATRIAASGQAVTVERLYERVLEDVVREAHSQLFHGTADVDMAAFRDEIATRTRRFLDEYTGP